MSSFLKWEMSESKFSFKVINKYTLVKIWKSLNNKSSTTTDSTGLSAKFLSLIMPIPNMVDILLEFLNNIIESKIVPNGLKLSTVIPLIKN